MKKIFFTGGTGFLGRNLIPALQDMGYTVLFPTRSELNLKDTEAVESYIKENRPDVIVHAAISNLLSSQEDIQGNVCKDSMLVFMNLYRMRDHYEKMIYFGSGAEFDKDRPIVSAKEDDFGISVPRSDYGLAKYIMNCLCRKSRNIYNLRLFGCFGPTDADFKLTETAIRCCLTKEDIRLHQECWFDFLYVDDIIPVLDYFIENEPSFHDYNMCSGTRYKISDICDMVRKQMDADVKIHMKYPGMNNEYTGNNARLLREVPDLRLTSIEEGIRKQIEYEKGVDRYAKEGC